ncbi:MAG: hypothetical protein ABIQ01_05755 [Pseudolysinimonas sp.]
MTAAENVRTVRDAIANRIELGLRAPITPDEQLLRDAYDALTEQSSDKRTALVLPTEPGTVIAIGAWWLVRLEPHEGSGPGCWELLPPRDETTRRSMEGNQVRAQCVYGDEWVLAEAEHEGHFTVIAEPASARPRPESPESLAHIIGHRTQWPSLHWRGWNDPEARTAIALAVATALTTEPTR